MMTYNIKDSVFAEFFLFYTKFKNKLENLAYFTNIYFLYF